MTQTSDTAKKFSLSQQMKERIAHEGLDENTVLAVNRQINDIITSVYNIFRFSRGNDRPDDTNFFIVEQREKIAQAIQITPHLIDVHAALTTPHPMLESLLFCGMTAEAEAIHALGAAYPEPRYCHPASALCHMIQCYNNHPDTRELIKMFVKKDYEKLCALADVGEDFSRTCSKHEAVFDNSYLRTFVLSGRDIPERMSLEDLAKITLKHWDVSRGRQPLATDAKFQLKKLLGKLEAAHEQWNRLHQAHNKPKMIAEQAHSFASIGKLHECFTQSIWPSQAKALEALGRMPAYLASGVIDHQPWLLHTPDTMLWTQKILDGAAPSASRGRQTS